MTSGEWARSAESASIQAAHTSAFLFSIPKCALSFNGGKDCRYYEDEGEEQPN